MDQPPTDSGNMSRSSNQQPDDLLDVINKYHSELAGTQAYLLNIKNNLGKVRDLYPGQLTEIVNRVHKSSGSVQSFYQSLEKLTGYLHSSSSYHALLVALHSVDKQLGEHLLSALTTFRDLSRTSSDRQIISQRQNVLNQLNKTIDSLRDANDIVNNIVKALSQAEPLGSNDTNSLYDEPPHPVDQPQPGLGQRYEQVDNPENTLLDNNRSANHDADEFQNYINPSHVFADHTELRKALHKAFNREDFTLLCSDLGINYDDLGGEKLEVKMQSLIDHFNRRNKYEQLVRMILTLHPYLSEGQDIQ